MSKRSSRKVKKGSTKRSTRKVVSKKGSAVRGWAKRSPKLISQRRTLKSKCGSKCFLMPGKLKFPICAKHSCKKDCKGITSAYVRARQWKYPEVAKKAKSLMKSMRCTKKYQ